MGLKENTPVSGLFKLPLPRMAGHSAVGLTHRLVRTTPNIAHAFALAVRAALQKPVDGGPLVGKKPLELLELVMGLVSMRLRNSVAFHARPLQKPPRNEFGAGLASQLAANTKPIASNRRDRDIKFGGDPVIGIALRSHGEHLALSI